MSGGWTRLANGAYECGSYRIEHVRNTRTKKQSGESVWLVFYKGWRISVQPTLRDAKQAADGDNAERLTKVEP